MGDPLAQRLCRLAKPDLEARDVFGRALIHLVTLLGRADLLEALLHNVSCNASAVDGESRWTALHYALFYGHLSCARLLVGRDSSLLRLKDRNGLTAMDITHLQHDLSNLKIWPLSVGHSTTSYTQRQSVHDDLIWWESERGGSDVYTLGVNVNYQLGTGDGDDKRTPFKVELPNPRIGDHSLPLAERLVKPRVRDLAISKNHSVLLTTETVKNVLIAGNASRGRLGNGSPIPNYKFKHVEHFADQQVVSIAVSDDHTVVLTSSGHVYAWGLNNVFQLGFQTEVVKEMTDTFSDKPRRIVGLLKKVKISGISCSKIHSCAYADSSLYIWGLNVGQMDIISTGEIIHSGKFKGSVQHPRKLNFPHKIKQVIATEKGTVVLLDNSECHLLTHGNHLRFQIPLYKTLNNEFKFFRPTKFSRKKALVKLVAKDCATIGILYDDGGVTNFGVDMFSKSSNIKYTEIWRPRNNHLKCTDVDIGADGSIVITTKSGCVFQRVAGRGKADYKFTKIDKVSKVFKVCCDSLFTSFGFIKDDVDQLPMELFKNRFLLDVSYLSPLQSPHLGRKRQELVDTSSYQQYTMDFLHKPDIELAEDESAIIQKQFEIVKDEEENKQIDPLRTVYRKRWTLPQSCNDTFEHPIADGTVQWLCSDSCSRFMFTGGDGDKDFDLRFEINRQIFGAHRAILSLLEPFRGLETDDVIIGDAHFYQAQNGVVKVDGLNPVSLLIMLNVLYTGEVLKPWEIPEATKPMKDIQKECLALLKSLKLIDELNRSIFDIHDRFRDRSLFHNDVTIKLQGGEEVYCWSIMLKARNAYFETLFSERWEGDTVLEFEHVRKEVFDVVLDYIYGCEQLQLLDSIKVSSSADFVNFCFELIEVADELLLLGLKDFAQLMIKDFINSENVLLILDHADSLNCQKLIGQCLWFVYNNVDSLLTDPNYELLSASMVNRIDKYCRWLGRVNKVIAPKDEQHWYDMDSNVLIRKFLSSKRDFNDLFLSNDDFVPLFDTPPKKDRKVESKLEPKKTMLSTPWHKPLVSTIPVQNANIADQLRKSILDSTAVEFADDDFQVATSRRRKSSSVSRRFSSGTALPSTPVVRTPLSYALKDRSAGTPSKSIPTPMLYKHRNSSSGPMGESGWVTHTGSNTAALSPMSNWASAGSSTASSPSSVASWMRPDEVGTSPGSSKIIFGAPRLSQKERKKLMKEKEPTPRDTVGSSPWKVQPRASIRSPSLVAAQEEALAECYMPSLKGIMHEEEHRVIESMTARAESLAEVQQEEEFAQWWENECRRVQGAQRVLNGSAGLNAAKEDKRKKKYRTRKQSVP